MLFNVKNSFYRISLCSFSTVEPLLTSCTRRSNSVTYGKSYSISGAISIQLELSLLPPTSQAKVSFIIVQTFQSKNAVIRLIFCGSFYFIEKYSSLLYKLFQNPHVIFFTIKYCHHVNLFFCFVC